MYHIKYRIKVINLSIALVLDACTFKELFVIIMVGIFVKLEIFKGLSFNKL
jgi:hypothetical protein